MRARKVDQGAARAMNRRLILDELRREGPMSRTRIAQQTSLSAASITIVTSDLLAEGLLIEHPELARQLPRHPVPLGINYAGHHAIGMKLLETEIQAVLTDLALNVVDQIRVPLDGPTPDHVVAAARVACDHLRLTQRDPLTPLIGVGLAMAGIIDTARGVCVVSHRAGWHHVPFGDLLRANLGVPVWIDNDANAFATAERLVGRARQAIDFVVVTLGRGIGAAIVLNGQVYRTPRGGAGELGHVLTEPGGRPCECGLRGCLQAYVSSPDLVAQFNDAYPDVGVRQVEELLALLDASDDRPLPILQDAGRRLGEALANLTDLLDPELIIIGGEGVVVGDALLSAMQAAFQARHLPDAWQPDVLVDRWSDDAWGRGAAGLVVEHFFEGSLSWAVPPRPPHLPPR
ncbi:MULTISPECIES: ROK family protein [Deinococcus]|uniref:ROK family protein n=1 Tax=Deinococcus rufus TaxID=2136097 RepID=A0ABV7Z2T0_9DEIO|nr:ROK family protein [Deinococcus sp. AB2017081]WQE95955.1 ROK family protein [Deinococcus sp. AB2017081]